MTNEQKRIAIAESCGWNFVSGTFGMSPDFPNNPDYEGEEIPDYLNDLNAMHEVEETLTHTQCYFYNGYIGSILGHWNPETGARTWPFHATARQRAEAFLRTIGKWTE